MPARTKNAIQRAEKTTPTVASSSSSSSTSTTNEDESSEEVYTPVNYDEYRINKKIAASLKPTTSKAIPLAPNQPKVLKLAHKSKTTAIGKIVGKKPTYTEANQVDAVIRIKVGGQKEILKTYSSSDTALKAKDPYQSAPPHNHNDMDVHDWAKLTVSSPDAEARLLPAVEEFTFQYMNFEQPKKTSDSQKKPVEEKKLEVHHMVTLVGAHGPCDGCQLRMQIFLRQWRAQAVNSPHRLRLTLCYVYKHARYKVMPRRTEHFSSAWKGGGEVSKVYEFHYGVTGERSIEYEGETLQYYRLTATN